MFEVFTDNNEATRRQVILDVFKRIRKDQEIGAPRNFYCDFVKNGIQGRAIKYYGILIEKSKIQQFKSALDKELGLYDAYTVFSTLPAVLGNDDKLLISISIKNSKDAKNQLNLPFEEEKNETKNCYCFSDFGSNVLLC